MEILSETKIYVWAPAGIATGGPEALHQLVYQLRNSLKINAFMYYVTLNNTTYDNPVHKEYEKYNNPYVLEIDDNSKNILIVPEDFNGISTIINFKRIKILVWWLSVDNYYMLRLSMELNISIEEIKRNHCFAIRYYKDIDLTKDNYLKRSIYHLTQCKYAEEHLMKRGFKNLFYLGDYLNEDYLNEDFNIKDKRDIVVYNPSKGFEFTTKIIRNSEYLRYIPISGRNRNQVKNLLKHSKVYIDFGYFPGKDRIPREAAMMGCCIISGKKGSANYHDDLPIPDNYKFDNEEENISNIINKIQDCIYNYEINLENFTNYRHIIKLEKENFIQNLQYLFIKK